MRVQKILYLDTTMKWDMIKKDGLLTCIIPKSLDAEESWALNKGYVYFATNLDEVLMYGLIKSLLDTRSDDLEKHMKSNPNYLDPIVLGINAFKLGGQCRYTSTGPTVKSICN